MKKFDYPEGSLKYVNGSSQANIFYSPSLDDALKERYGRDGLCLKAFYRPKFYEWANEQLKDFRWGGCNFLTRSSEIQNIYAWYEYGLSPRVYDIVRIDNPPRAHGRNWLFAQVTDFVEGWPFSQGVEEYHVIRRKVDPRYHIEKRIQSPDGEWHGHSQNFGKWVCDFQTYRLLDREAYLESLLERIRGGGSKPYQAIEELGIDGRRQTVAERGATFRLDSIDFEGKTVLDIGCASGAFSREAVRRGAKHVVGVDKGKVGDWDSTALQAHELSNWLGFWNINYFNLSMPSQLDKVQELSGIEQFDIVFMLAAIRHIGWAAPWMRRVCKEVCIVEGHLENSEADWPIKYEHPLREIFESVEFLGISERRPVYRCK